MIPDDQAIHILKTIARARLQPTSGEPIPDASVLLALSAAFEPSPLTAVSEADLARAALDLLAQDPTFTEPIKIMSAQPTSGTQRYLDPGSIALTTAALLVLQTRVKFKLDSNRKWSFELDKKSSSDGAVKLLVQRLLSFLKK
jgi:hypothetical protein